jgi:hypothetical protein
MHNSFLDNMPNRKQRSRINHLNFMNTDETVKLLTFFSLQGLRQKAAKNCYSRKKMLERPTSLELFTERKFHLLLNFLHSVDNVFCDEATCGSKILYKIQPVMYHQKPSLEVCISRVWCISRRVYVDVERTSLRKIYVSLNMQDLVENLLNCAKPNLVWCGISLCTLWTITPQKISHKTQK